MFPNTSNGKSLSQAGMSSVIKRMGRAGQITVHGFRSTFRDYIAEKTELDGSIAEHALAHKLKDKSVAAYQRGALIDKFILRGCTHYCTHMTINITGIKKPL